MPSKQIVCNHTGKTHNYEITRGLNPAIAIQADAEWAVEKNIIVQQLLAENPAARLDVHELLKLLPTYNLEDWHWKWSDKAMSCNGPEYEWFYLTANGKVQGVAIIYHPKGSKLKHDNIFYVDYLATAHWNRPRPNYTRQFAGIGSLLLCYCLDYAVQTLKYRPGFSLHSLPHAEPYYAKIGMVDLGLDASKDNLRFFEAPEVIAKKLCEARHG
jgi:hypothetical protein